MYFALRSSIIDHSITNSRSKYITIVTMWLLVALAAAFLVTGHGQTIVEVDVTESRSFRLSVSDTEIQSCYVTLPSGTTLELLPNNNVTLIDERYSLLSSDETTICGLAIDSTSFSDSGSYVLTITDTAGVSHTGNYELRVQGRTAIWPASTIDLIASETVYIFLQNPEGTVQNCYVTAPGSEEVEVAYGATISNNIKQWSPSSDSWCGVEIANVDSVGYWKLTAAVNATHFYYNRTLLNPEDSSTSADTQTIVTPVVGQSLTDYIGHENASYCQLTNPQGEVDQVVAGRCSFNLSVVTSQHNGTWKASTGLKGSPTEITETIDLNVQAIQYIHAGSSENKVISGAIDLYCRIDGVESEVCRFVSPTGTGVSMVLGVGNEKYAPYYDPEELYTCGLTIIQLSSDDYGTWRCYTGNSTDVRIGYISVDSSEAETKLTKSATTTRSVSVSESYTAYSVYNESLTLACSALTSLNYCWFGHPNGSYYAALPDVTDNELWAYSGTGLSLGSCSITFTHSTYDDSGSWTCNMGISGEEKDVSVDITVRVTSSSLTATSIEERSDGTATVECTVLDDTKALSYCRFIRPDGVGINAMYADSESTYSMTGDLSQGTCGLAISTVQDVDKGTWVCLGKLESYSVELSDTFRLSSAPKFGLSLLLLGVSIIKTLMA